jgi:xanthine dehydrogenase accessory factor
MSKAVFEALAAAARTGEAVTLGIISGVKGSSPQKLGAKAVFYADGRICGTLGGGCLEAEIQKRAVAGLRTAQAASFDLLLDHDFGWDDGLICGGKVQGLILPNAQKLGEAFWSELAARKTLIEWGIAPDFTIRGGPAKRDRPSMAACQAGHTESSIADDCSVLHENWLYRETVTPPCELWIAGAGHIAQAVAPLGAKLDFSVTVLDDRPALASHDFFPSEVTLKADTWERLLSLPLGEAPAFGLIVTRGHRHDALVLQSWLQKPFVFLGMIGSKRKARTIFDHFLEEKLATREQLQLVACPVGIKIRSRTVMEIAVSILAQYVDKRAELVLDKVCDRATGKDEFCS